MSKVSVTESFTDFFCLLVSAAEKERLGCGRTGGGALDF